MIPGEAAMLRALAARGARLEVSARMALEIDATGGRSRGDTRAAFLAAVAHEMDCYERLSRAERARFWAEVALAQCAGELPLAECAS